MKRKRSEPSVADARRRTDRDDHVDRSAQEKTDRSHNDARPTVRTGGQGHADRTNRERQASRWPHEQSPVVAPVRSRDGRGAKISKSAGDARDNVTRRQQASTDADTSMPNQGQGVPPRAARPKSDRSSRVDSPSDQGQTTTDARFKYPRSNTTLAQNPMPPGARPGLDSDRETDSTPQSDEELPDWLDFQSLMRSSGRAFWEVLKIFRALHFGSESERELYEKMAEGLAESPDLPGPEELIKSPGIEDRSWELESGDKPRYGWSLIRVNDTDLSGMNIDDATPITIEGLLELEDVCFSRFGALETDLCTRVGFEQEIDVYRTIEEAREILGITSAVSARSWRPRDIPFPQPEITERSVGDGITREWGLSEEGSIFFNTETQENVDAPTGDGGLTGEVEVTEIDRSDGGSEARLTVGAGITVGYEAANFDTSILVTEYGPLDQKRGIGVIKLEGQAASGRITGFEQAEGIVLEFERVRRD